MFYLRTKYEEDSRLLLIPRPIHPSVNCRLLRPGPQRDRVGAQSKIKGFVCSRAQVLLFQFCTVNKVYVFFEKTEEFKNRTM